MLAVMQRTISKLFRGFEFTAAGEGVPQLVYADDGLFLSNDIGYSDDAARARVCLVSDQDLRQQPAGQKEEEIGVVSDVLGEQRGAGC